MNRSKSLVYNLKQFSGFKPLHYSDNVSVSISYDFLNKDVNFDFFHNKSLSPGSCSLKIMSLLQEISKIGIKITDDSQLCETKNHSQFMKAEESTDFVIFFPRLENLPENAEFIFPLLNSRLSLLYKSSSEERDLYVRNLTSDVWLYLVITLTLVTLCFRLSTYIHHRFQPKHGDWSWPETVQLILGAVCQQGSAKEPQGNSCRSMFVIGYFIAYLIFTAFAAGITSLLAVTSDRPETQWEEALSSDMSYVTLCGSDGHSYLENRAKHLDLSYKCVDSMQELIRLVEQNSFRAVLSEGNLHKYLATGLSEELRCDMSVSKQSTHGTYHGFAIKKGSYLKQSMNYWLLRMKEHGLLKRVWDRCSQRVPVCHMPPGYTQVGLGHVKTAFMVMALSNVAALVIFVCELIYKRCQTNKRSNQKQNNPRRIFMPEKMLSGPNECCGFKRVFKKFPKSY